MLDAHNRLYGINAPDILGIPAYTFFVGLGITAGLLYYFTDLKHRGQVGEGAVKIVFSALVCGVIGSKLPLLLEGRSAGEILFGKSIVGGLIGGMLGVIVCKKIFGIKQRLGNVIAPSIALGMTFGRLGCFFNGCCYGIASSWGLDFGDGLTRLPVQLLEAMFHLAAFALLLYYRKAVKTPGILFKAYLFAYFVFRFAVEFIRENPVLWPGLTIYQIICGLGAIYMSIIFFTRHREAKNGSGEQHG